MDRLPDHFVRDVICRLPLVDAFRLVRVARRFDRLLHPQLTTLHIDQKELLLQFRERNLGSSAIQPLIENILAFYGQLLVKLELSLPLIRETMHKELVMKIVGNCPNLVELTLTFPWELSFLDMKVLSFPATGLLQMPKLKVLKARLCFDLVQATNTSVETILDRMLEMDEIGLIFLHKNIELQTAARNRGLPVNAAKNVVVTSLVDFNSNLYPGLESMAIFSWDKPDCSFVPFSLSKLAIRTNIFGNDWPFEASLSLTKEDLAPLERLANLTEFWLDDSLGRIQWFDFLRCFGKLESISIWSSKYFGPAAFAHIPESAPLVNVALVQCRAVGVCKLVCDCLAKRKGLKRVRMMMLKNSDDAELFGQVVANHCDTLTHLHVDCQPEITDQFLDQLLDESVLGLEDLNLTKTRVTANGIRQLVERRRRLIKTATLEQSVNLQNPDPGEPSGEKRGRLAGGLPRLKVPRSLLRILCVEQLVNELATESQLVCEAMVYMDIGYLDT